MSKCKLYLCKRCNKTYSVGEVSREENVCRACIRKEDTSEARKNQRLKVPRKDKSNPEKLAPYIEDNYL